LRSFHEAQANWGRVNLLSSAPVFTSFQIQKGINFMSEISDLEVRVIELEAQVKELFGVVLNAYGDNGSRETERKFRVTCDQCGDHAMVPFQPAEGRLVYCKLCFRKQKFVKVCPT
jgi:CxxC-x17-CxxC domain-containing protein